MSQYENIIEVETKICFSKLFGRKNNLRCCLRAVFLIAESKYQMSKVLAGIQRGQFIRDPTFAEGNSEWHRELAKSCQLETPAACKH